MLLDDLPLPTAYAPDDGPVQCNRRWLEWSSVTEPPVDLVDACAQVVAWEAADMAAAREWIALLTPDDPPLPLGAPLRSDRSKYVQVLILSQWIGIGRAACRCDGVARWTAGSGAAT